MKRIMIVLMMFGLFSPGLFAQTKSYIDNIVVVMDSSSSMGETMRDASGNNVRKMDAAKDALKEVLKQTPQTTHVGILRFGDWVYPLGERNDANMYVAIDKIRARGGTPLGEYIKHGADELLKARKKQYGYGSYRLLIVTDGEASDQNLVEKYTPEVIGRGIIVDVIGVDMSGSHSLSKMAHSYRKANDPEALKQAIREILVEGSGTANQDVGEAFEFLEGFPPECASALMQGFSSNLDYPIGEKPPAVESQDSENSQDSGDVQDPNAGSGGDGGLSAGALILIVFFGIVFIVILIGGGINSLS